MAALTQKQLRNAAPVDTLPYAVQRKYEDERYFGTLSQVKALLLRDLDDMDEFAARSGTSGDRNRIAGVRRRVDALSEETLPMNEIVVIDEYTQTKYQVKVWDRRKQ